MRDAFAWKWKLSARDWASGLLLITPAPSPALYGCLPPSLSLSLCPAPRPFDGLQLQAGATIAAASLIELRSLTHSNWLWLPFSLFLLHSLSAAPAQRGRTPRSMARSGVQLVAHRRDRRERRRVLYSARAGSLSISLTHSPSLPFSLLRWMPCASCNLWLVATAASAAAAAKKRQPQPQWVEKSEDNLGKTVGAKNM